MTKNELPPEIREKIAEGTIIPSIPLALNERRRYDEKRERALIRYYIDAGAGGIAAGAYITQFEIRSPEYNLFEQVMRSVSRIIDEHSARRNKKIVKIGGICGRSSQALKEADFLRENGFHAGLLSMSSFAEDPLDEMIAHVRRVAEILPVFGFYLSPAAGGRILSFQFWRRLAEIDNIAGIKIAPFNRHQTIDVIRAICDAGRENDIPLYTGNEDSIITDLLTEYRIVSRGQEKRLRIKGSLLGQWSIWTQKAVELHKRCLDISQKALPAPQELLTLAAELTDANAAIFDAAHRFAGCIPGIHDVLRRQGFFEGIRCLKSSETLSPGQAAEIDRVYASYPHLRDDDFVKARLPEWFAD
jgi:dihydrodipicolinate synthase/N-acetylneuraminate lyase